MSSPVHSINALIEDVVRRIVAVTEAAAASRLRGALAAAFDAPVPGPVRPRQARALEPASAKPAAARRAPTATAKLLRARKLQGQYLGALRSLGQGDRAKVKALAKANGVPAALKLAASLKKNK
jgi:hypothetical protein